MWNMSIIDALKYSDEFSFFRYLDIESLPMDEWETIHCSDRCVIMCKRTKEGNYYKLEHNEGFKREFVMELFEDNITNKITKTRENTNAKIPSVYVFFSVAIQKKGSLKHLKNEKSMTKIY